MNELVLAAKAFGDPARVRVLYALRNEELCVCELCDVLAVTQSTLSTHLQVIRKAGLATARRQGKWMYYVLSSKGRQLVEALFGAFDRTLMKNSTLKADAAHLKQRLSIRANGACCVGYGDGSEQCKKPKK